ncbi:CPBP family intramembrane metalloprotease [Candidatus Desantisbacteria bacterium]|nr:CPBP family intramembrane metalloprotease [Candidatus Desantisbacteria bacterium]
MHDNVGQGYSLANQYGNIVYFFILLVTGFYMGEDFFPDQYRLKNKNIFLSGIALMFLLYAVMILSYIVIHKFPFLQKRIDLSLWQYFVKPWHEINIILSIISVIMIVLAVELFYRVYVQNTFNLFFSDNASILLASALSGIRAASLGPISGFVDFSLAVIWGFVYKRSGLLAAILTHLIWDILFVYFPFNLS